MVPVQGRLFMLVVVLAAGACLPAGASAATAPPRSIQLDSGWEIRDAVAAPAEPQPAPPDESEEGNETPNPETVPDPTKQANTDWRPVRVPSVFATDAAPALFGGTVKIYRLRFTAPRAPGFRWAFRFEQSRRRTIVSLNGRRLGISIDPYTPFEVEAKGLKPGRSNELQVYVDSRKDPRLPEGWWNWGGITRPVSLVPRGRVGIRDLGLLSDVRCRGRATRCRASLRIEGTLSMLPRGRSQPRLTVRLRSPLGRVTRRTFKLRGSSRARRAVTARMPVPSPQLWSPERPQLYDAEATLSYRGRVAERRRLAIGLRSVDVKRGLLYLNNRRIQLRGASMHEDFPGMGAALNGKAMDTMVRELQELGANVTRAHYVLSEALLRRLDRAGILVWNQAPVWQRDHGANLLGKALERRRALAQVERTIKAARNHPSVITHSVANELSFIPDQRAGTRRFLIDAAKRARRLDPTLPISLDIKGRPGFVEQFTWHHFDMIGINQYFGWYPWVKDFALLTPYLEEMHDLYPEQALVMTEFGAEGRPDRAAGPLSQKGSYAFQAMHVGRTLDVVDRLPFMNGAIHWTLREFEIFPGWRGGAGPGPGRNTRHHKGLLTYTGERKPAWQVVHDHYARIPLYR
jgi:beta-glucuronidase